MAELIRRIAFTIGALLAYRFGTFVPLPGLDPTALAYLYQDAPTADVHHVAVLALGVTPYISAAIILQLLTLVARPLKALKRRGAQGRRALDRMTRYLTVLLTAFQALGVAIGFESEPRLIAVAPWLFTVSTVITLTGGTLFLVWLAEQITNRGIGNGLMLFIVLPIVIGLPGTLADLLELGRRGVLTSEHINKLVPFVVGFIVFLVVMERARRLVVIRYSERRIGVRSVAAQLTYLPLKLNGAGILPVLLTSGMMSGLIALLDFAARAEHSGPAAAILVHLDYGQPWRIIVYAVLLFGCTVLYTALLWDPPEMAENLRKYGGSIETNEPGEPTATYLDRVLSRITLTGACYLVVVIAVWEMFVTRIPATLHFNSASLLILICATLDLDAEARAYIGRKGSPPTEPRTSAAA